MERRFVFRMAQLLYGVGGSLRDAVRVNFGMIGKRLQDGYHSVVSVEKRL